MKDAFLLTEQQRRNLLSARLLHTRLEDAERWSSRWRFSTQFHDGSREEASQAFQVAEQ